MSAAEARGNGESIQKVAVVPSKWYPKGFQQLASVATAQSLTVPTGARIALVHAEGQTVRWRDDGTAPTAAIGMRLPAGSELTFDGDLTAIQFIEETSGAKVNISYYA